jgi:hypothetical protein
MSLHVKDPQWVVTEKNEFGAFLSPKSELTYAVCRVFKNKVTRVSFESILQMVQTAPEAHELISEIKKLVEDRTDDLSVKINQLINNKF